MNDLAELIGFYTVAEKALKGVIETANATSFDYLALETRAMLCQIESRKKQMQALLEKRNAKPR